MEVSVMQVSKFGPCFIVDDVPAAARFYEQHLGFAPTSDVGWFISLSNGDQSYEISFLQRGHEFLPVAYRDRAVAGVVIGFVVADAAAEERRLRAAGVPILHNLVDEPFGQRHFLCTDPNGIVIDIIELIPPDPAWLASQGG
jgi:catechol 2,3-dioxygenase-like lactoylglutathione lyase family enzyme